MLRVKKLEIFIKFLKTKKMNRMSQKKIGIKKYENSKLKNLVKMINKSFMSFKLINIFIIYLFLYKSSFIVFFNIL